MAKIDKETLHDLNKAITPSKRKILEESIASALYSVLGDNLSSKERDNLKSENKILKSENSRLRAQIAVNDKVNDVSEAVLFSRWSTNKIITLGKRVDSIKRKEWDIAYKIRLAIWTIVKRIWLNKDDIKKFKKMNKFDINEWYKIVTSTLKQKISESAEPGEMVAIRSLMKNINGLHEEYANSILVTWADRMRNMRDIDNRISMAA